MNSDSDILYEQMVQLLTNAQLPLRRYIRTLVFDRADAEDVLQEANLLAWRRIKEYQHNTNFTAWVCKIAYFQVLTLRKQNARNRLRFSDQLVEQLAASVSADSGWGKSDAEAFELCMAKLRSQDRELVQLRYEPNATIESVALHVGRSIKAVYNAMSRIRTRLLECIQQNRVDRRVS